VQSYQTFWSNVKIRDAASQEIIAIYCTNLQQPHTFDYAGQKFSSFELAQALLDVERLRGRVRCPRSKQLGGTIYSWGWRYCQTYKGIIQSPWNLARKEGQQYNHFIAAYAEHCVLSSYEKLAQDVALEHAQKLQHVRSVIGKTPFSTCNININVAYEPHLDIRDLPGTARIVFSKLLRRCVFSC
jgi:hypothetical protein